MRQAFYGTLPNRTILLDDLVCTGAETNMSQCHRVDDKGIEMVGFGDGVTDCTHDEDAGVRCSGKYMFLSTYIHT